MVERFNSRIADLLRTRHFGSGEHLKDTLRDYQRLYNHQIGQKALGHRTPVRHSRPGNRNAPIYVVNVYLTTRELDTRLWCFCQG